MKENSETASSSLGLILIGLGLFTVFFSQNIRDIGLGDNHDPGAKALPIALAIGLILGGVRELVQWFRHKPTNISDHLRTTWQARPHRNLFLVLAAIGLYLPLLNWAGFSSSTLLLSAVLASLLGARWWSSILGSVILVAAVKLLFGVLFRVPLPEGTLGLGF